MGNRPKQDTDHPRQPPQPPQRTPADTPRQREERRQNDRPLGDDPAKEGPPNESLPEGAAGGRKAQPSGGARGKRGAAAPADTPQTPDRRGDGSALPSNVRREKPRA